MKTQLNLMEEGTVHQIESNVRAFYELVNDKRDYGGAVPRRDVLDHLRCTLNTTDQLLGTSEDRSIWPKPQLLIACEEALRKLYSEFHKGQVYGQLGTFPSCIDACKAISAALLKGAKWAVQDESQRTPPEVFHAG
jgi:hypothetical protein